MGGIDSINKTHCRKGIRQCVFCFWEGVFIAASTLTAMNRESYVRGNQFGLLVQGRPPGPICPPEDAEPVTCEPPEAVPPSETL